MASESLPVRSRPTRAKLGTLQRDSNVIRASVLETALELGFGQSSTVANWIFNNPLSEEAEELDDQVRIDTNSEPALDVPEATTPTFTSGSNSTSDESSLNSPAIAPNAAVTTIQVHMQKPSVAEPPHIHFDDFSSDQLQLFSPFTLSPHDAHHAGTRGISVGLPTTDTERSGSQDESLRCNPSHDSSSTGPADAGYVSEGQYLSKGKAGKGKDKTGKKKGDKGSRPKTGDTSKPCERDVGYASDGGYLSASSNRSQGKSPGKVKSRAMAFFRRRSKKSPRGSDDEDEESIPPVPAIPILPRPSSPKPLERRAAPSSPTRSGFAPLTLNLANPSPPRRRMSKSPPPAHTRPKSPQQLNHTLAAQRPASPIVVSASAPTILTPAATAATIPLPPSIPSTPLSTASFHIASSTSMQSAAGTHKSLTTSSSRQHLTIPPPAPPPTLPLPLPPSPMTPSTGVVPPSPSTPTTPSRKPAPTRSIPAAPTTPGSTRPLSPRRAASPLRPVLSPRALPAVLSHARLGEFSNASDGDLPNSKEVHGRQRPGLSSFGSTPAFLQRKIQHGPPPSPRHPPPDMPLPPSPCLNPSVRPRTPIGSPSKFHEHFSSISSVPLSQVLSTPKSLSPSPSTVALSESSSGLSVRSSHISSASGRSEEPVIRDPLNVPEYPRPTTSTSTLSESSYGQPIASTLGRFNRSDISSSVYPPLMRRNNSSVNTFDDIDNADPRSCADADDDASVYPSEEKTAGRRTMYLMENGELDEDGDEIVVAGSHYWGGHEVPPPLPPLPPLPTRPGPGYF